MKIRMKKLLSIGVPTLLLILLAAVYFFAQPGFLSRGGWHGTDSGAVQYRDYYGRPVSGWQEIDGFRYYFSEQDCSMYTGWLEQDDHWLYLKENGQLAIGWEDTDLGPRYFDEQGKLQTGWFLLDGSYYYLDTRGIMQTGRIQLDNTEHFLTDSGAAYTGWLEEDGCKYYYDNKGVRQTGWVEVDRIRFYLDSDGAMQTGWMEIDDHTYFLTDSGTAHTGWLEQDGRKYFFDEAGMMQTGWVEVDCVRFYLDSDGAMQTGWMEIDGHTYFLADSGAAHTGWLEQDDRKYFFDEAGIMQTGWAIVDNIRYYLQDDGSLATGFITVDGIDRYFAVDGAYIPLVNPWNAVPEDYALNLVLFEGFQVDASCRKNLQRMFLDCGAAGFPCKMNSGYRSIDEQTCLWDEYYNNFVQKGYSPEDATKLTNQQVAIPGTSEHHTGLAVDISASYNAYAWLEKNSWRYGFIMRYPEDKISVTGIIYEPWHFRYVGKELAKTIYQSGLTLEEWLQYQKR